MKASQTTMAAVAHTAYGGPEVLRLERMAVAPVRAGEVLVRVRAASVCRGDGYIMTGKPYLVRLMGFGLLRPRLRRFGQDFSGQVEAVGRDVDGFRPGDEVYGQVATGAFAEYVAAPAARIAAKPANLSHEEAAAVPDSGLTALQGLRDVAGLRAGERVLVNGASGGVGTFAVQIAKALGAEVTAVCSTRHLAKVRSLGADRVVDYTREDFAGSSERYHAILDLAGNRSLAECCRVLTRKGVLVSSAGGPFGSAAGPLLRLGHVLIAGAFSTRKLAVLVMQPRADDLAALKVLIESGKVAPVIERRYTLAEAGDALRHLLGGHAQGKTVISVP